MVSDQVGVVSQFVNMMKDQEINMIELTMNELKEVHGSSMPVDVINATSNLISSTIAATVSGTDTLISTVTKGTSSIVGNLFSNLHTLTLAPVFNLGGFHFSPTLKIG
jgi:hypothetical protein